MRRVALPPLTWSLHQGAAPGVQRRPPGTDV